MAAQLPNQEFYLRCIAKCRAVPEGERSPNVRSLLESHELIEAGLAEVPLPPAFQQPRRRRPARSRAAASVAIARYLRAYVIGNASVPHPIDRTPWLTDHLGVAGAHAFGGTVCWVAPPPSPFPPPGAQGAVEAVGVLLRSLLLGVRGRSWRRGGRSARAAGSPGWR